MSLPPLYKYLDVQGAKLTLGNECFRFAKPSDYKDLEDMTAQSLFPDALEKALPMLSDAFVDAIMTNIHAPPTCSPKQRALVTTLQSLFRMDPKQADFVKEGLRKDPAKAGMSLDYWKTQSDEFVKNTNTFMQNYRVFCVTTDKISDRMWKEYAEADRGTALRITPNTDSMYEKFAPVTYREKRPPIFAKTGDFAVESLFGDQAERARAALHGIIYSKTMPYKFESEYRLAIPLGEGEEDYRTQPFQPDEITELYLGAAISDTDKQEILALAKTLNGRMKIFQAKRDPTGKISFTGA
jgi:hypothetical protein